jgi:hypothetical protein
MCIDERIERVEHITAAHIEPAKKDYDENRRLWREQQTDIAAIWKRIEDRDREWDRRMAESRRQFDAGMQAMREEMASRDQVMDKRIGDLVGAIGELNRKR